MTIFDNTWIFCIIILTLCCVEIHGVAVTSSTKRAVLEVRLDRYTNPDGVGSNGACCEAFSSFSALGCRVSNFDGCDTKFDITISQKLANGGKAGLRFYSSQVWVDTNSINFGNSIGNGIPNPNTVELSYWDTSYGYLVEITVKDDDNGGNGADLIARWSKTYRQLGEVSNGLSGRDGIRLDITVTGRCKPGYYGTECMMYCLPQRNYNCNQTTGSKICLPGYEGESCVETDECLSNPCQHGGTCVDNLNSFSCLCPTGYRGVYCELDINYCTASACNHGNCVEQQNSYRCDCFAGYTGRRCDVDIDECASMPCYGSATCLDSVNGFSCLCPLGYEGRLCEINHDDCEHIVCNNQGTCIDGVNEFRCSCTERFTGRYCETLVDKCDENRCSVHSSCVENAQDPKLYSCQCDDGFRGDYCKDGCTHQCVGGHGRCTADSTGNLVCTCFPGYEGSNCEIDINECELNPCDGDICIDEINSYRCEKDDKCINSNFANKLAQSFCEDILNVDHCDSLTLDAGQKEDFNAVIQFSMFSFQCNLTRFLTSRMDEFNHVLNGTGSLQMCTWDLGMNISCFEINSTSKSLDSSTYSYYFNQSVKESQRLSPSSNFLSFEEIVRKYWYFLAAGSLVILSILVTIICITKRSKSKMSQSKGMMSYPPLPNLPSFDKYGGATYSNPAFNSLHFLSLNRKNCEGSQENDHIYEEPTRKHQMNGKKGETNSYNLKHTEFYSEPLVDDSALYANPDDVRTFIPSHSELKKLPLPPLPKVESAEYVLPARSYEPADQFKQHGKFCKNPLYTYREAVSDSLTASTKSFGAQTMGSDCVQEEEKFTPVRDRALAMQEKLVASGKTTNSFQHNPLYSKNPSDNWKNGLRSFASEQESQQYLQPTELKSRLTESRNDRKRIINPLYDTK